MQERGDVGSYVRVSFSIKILRHSRGATSYFFREGYTSWNEDTLIKVLPARHERKSLQGKISLFFHLDTSISNEKFNSQMNTIRPFLFLFFVFFQNQNTFLQFSTKGRGDLPPSTRQLRSCMGVFMRILQNFQEHLFYRRAPVAASGICLKLKQKI